MKQQLESLQAAWDNSPVKAYLDRQDKRLRWALYGVAALIPVLLLYAALRPPPPAEPVKEERERGPIKFVMPAFLDISRPATPETERPGPLPKQGLTARVYFFHMNGRTEPCLALEQYVRETVKTVFAGPQAGWTVQFEPVNLEQGENYRFADTYKLATKAVIVQRYDGEKPLDWRELDRAWALLRSTPALAGYLAAETKKFLSEPVPGVSAGAAAVSTETAAGQPASGEAPLAVSGAPAAVLPGMEDMALSSGTQAEKQTTPAETGAVEVSTALP